MAQRNDLEWFARTLGLYASYALVGIFIVNFAIADWNLNLVHDIFFSAIRGPLLYENQPIPALYLMCLVVFLIIKLKYHPFSAMVLIFATVSLHEFLLTGFSILAYGTKVTPMLLSPSYALWLGAFLILALVRSNKKEKLIILQATILMFAVFSIITSYEILFNWKPIIVIGFSPGPDYYNIYARAVTLIGWIIPSSVWWLLK